MFSEDFKVLYINTPCPLFFSRFSLVKLFKIEPAFFMQCFVRRELFGAIVPFLTSVNDFNGKSEGDFIF